MIILFSSSLNLQCWRWTHGLTHVGKSSATELRGQPLTGLSLLTAVGKQSKKLLTRCLAAWLSSASVISGQSVQARFSQGRCIPGPCSECILLSGSNHTWRVNVLICRPCVMGSIFYNTCCLIWQAVIISSWPLWLLLAVVCGYCSWNVVGMSEELNVIDYPGALLCQTGVFHRHNHSQAFY